MEHSRKFNPFTGVLGRGLLPGLATLMLLWSATLAPAQLTTANVSGTVTDPSGAAVPGASITVRNTETGISRSTVSGSNGRYEVVNLPVGNYEVSAQASGFQTSLRTGLELTVGRNAVVDHSLQVGNVAEQVTVTGEAPLIETTTATVTQLIDERSVENLPLNNRDLTQLTYLQPGVIKSPAGHGVFGGNGDKISVAGARGTQNLFLLDGVSNVDLSNNPQGATGSYGGAETVKEFQVVTNSYSAEYQSAAGAIVSAVTKSGTNSLHGSAFWYHRNDNLDAFKWEDKALAGDEEPNKGEFKRNQYGGSLGGPIIRDKTFFFGTFEGTKERRSGTSSASTLTNESRARVSDPLLVPYLSLWPVAGVGNTALPNEPANPGTIQISGPKNEPVNGTYVLGKFDHQFGNPQVGFLSGTYNYDDSDVTAFGLLGDVSENVTNGGSGTDSKKHTISVGHTSAISASTVNDFKFGYSWSEILGEFPSSKRDTKALSFHPNRDRVGQINITGGPTAVGFRVDGSAYVQRALQFREGLSLTKGNHSLRLGGELKQFRYKQASCSRGCNGIYTFSNMNDFFVNIANDFQVFAPGHESPERNMRQLLMGTYFQDNWQVTPSFTLNLGMRYEFVTVPDEDNHLISNLVNFFDRQVSVTTQAQAMFPNEPFAGTVEEFFKNPTLKSFSPRFGFAWAPGDRRTSLRGGYAIFYDYPMLFALRTALQELPPFVETARVRRNTAGTNALKVRPQSVNFYSAFISDPANSSFNVRYMEPNQSNTYVHRWSLTLQHDLGSSMVVSAGYTGSRGLHLLHQSLSNICKWIGWPNEPAGPKQFVARAANAGTCGGNANLLNPAFGEVRTQSSNANSYFHGLALGFQKRMSSGFSVQSAYNFSKSTDQGSGVTSGGEEFPQGQRGIYFWDMELKKGLSAFDIRHTLTTNFTYELPTGNLTGAAAAIAGGWQFHGILTLTAGHPLSVEESSVVQINSIGDDENLRPNLKSGGNNNPVLGGPDRYYDISQFEPSTPGFFGTLGASTLSSPGVATMDFSLVKSSRFAENKDVQFRIEFFNLLNRPNFGTPDTTAFINGAPNADAGRIRSTRGSARQIQLALRYTF